MGSIVDIIRDGKNGAPTLSKFDVGFVMFAGTEQASDIVIIDNNFSSI